MDDPQLDTIRELSEPILAAEGAELVEMSCHRHGGQGIIRLLVDKVGGVTIQECATLNQLIGKALDASGGLTASYTLEVSSPGLDRPLSSRRDFERALGEDVELELTEPVEESRRVKGMLLAVQESAIVLKMPTANLTIPMGQIRLAKKVIRV